MPQKLGSTIVTSIAEYVNPCLGMDTVFQKVSSSKENLILLELSIGQLIVHTGQ